MKIKTGDNVKVLSGKDRAKTGKVTQVIFDKKKERYFVVVEGVNKLKKHMRAQKRGEKGQVIELPTPMDISKVALIDPATEKTTRVGYKSEGGEKKRISKKTGQLL
ncbi:MAG: 50S ribosomal protein L24 [Patescibacteria group bacterium]